MIKVAYCLAYDWDLIRNSLPRIYPHAGRICLSIDRRRMTWTGKPFQIDESGFRSYVASIDTASKISVLEDDFYQPGKTPMENETRQRNMMAAHLGEGGWHCQVDVDEYFLNFGKFVEFLRQINPAPRLGDQAIAVSCPVIPLFKRLDRGYVFIRFRAAAFEPLPFATTFPQYGHARHAPGTAALSSEHVIHETWARTEEGLLQKLDNWGHSQDLNANKASYLRLWRAIDDGNCVYVRNVHPLHPELWPELAYCEGATIDALISNLNRQALYGPVMARLPKSDKSTLRQRIGGLFRRA